VKTLSRHPIAGPASRAFLRRLFRLLGGLVSIDAGNVPARGPVLICPNHLSNCDPHVIMATCPRADIYFVAMDELFEIKVLGPIIRAFGAVPIKRGASDLAAIRQSIAILESGAALVVFPEGRLSKLGNLGPIHPGAAMMALRAHAPIVPVGLARTNLFLPYGAIIPRPSPTPARIRYGKPIEHATTDGNGRKAVAALTARIEAEIRRLTGQD
jgi:1-acyl-sn-glycerol-3-phosphate acyltransferase